MITIYRAVSQQEIDDYDDQQIFRTGKNTLEAKQFFKSRTATTQFVARSILQDYYPPYTHLLIISINDDCLSKVDQKNMDLDGFDAITIYEDHLPNFNNCVRFVRQELL